VNFLDTMIGRADRLLRTVAGPVPAQRPSPAKDLPPAHLDDDARRHAAGLMRVNHTGEVCAQALYEGQAMVAKAAHVRRALRHAAAEEEDHLSWCEERLRELHARPSVFNPLFYGASFAMGAVTGLLGDRVSLGFVHATEDRVVAHLEDHQRSLPEDDHRSRAIIEQMRVDEAEHGEAALDLGGAPFPAPVRALMAASAKLMTETTYRL